MRRLILIFAAIAPVATIALVIAGRPWLGIGVLALSHAFILVPTLMPNAQWLGSVITRFETGGNEVWLTIDDGPADDTAAIVDMLDHLGVVATFFVKGELAAAHPDRIGIITDHGHALGNHSQTHPSGSFWCLPPAALRREIDGCAETLRRITGAAPALFRAPVGMKNPFVHPLLRARGMTLVGWSVRGFDAVRDRGEEVTRRIVEELAPGAIIVMHQGRPWSVSTMAQTIEAVKGRGYRFVVPDPARLKTNR